jgi:hypothetical protein
MQSPTSFTLKEVYFLALAHVAPIAALFPLDRITMSKGFARNSIAPTPGSQYTE